MKVTERWLRRAFALLVDYLEREHSDKKDLIMPFMEFMVNQDQRFYYRNAFTKGSIILDQAGQLVSCDKDALQYEFEFGRSDSIPVNRPPKEQTADGEVRRRYLYFLQEYWGPMVNYDFGDLKIGYR